MGCYIGHRCPMEVIREALVVRGFRKVREVPKKVGRGVKVIRVRRADDLISRWEAQKAKRVKRALPRTCMINMVQINSMRM